jgi:hypothetical protein
VYRARKTLTNSVFRHIYGFLKNILLKLVMLSIVKLLQNSESLLIDYLLSLVVIDERICKHFNLNEVGNEQHYLMQCSNPTFNEIRSSFIQKWHQIDSSFSLFNNQDLFVYIISMKDKTIMKIVAKFCFTVIYYQVLINCSNKIMYLLLFYTYMHCITKVYSALINRLNVILFLVEGYYVIC